MTNVVTLLPKTDFAVLEAIEADLFTVLHLSENGEIEVARAKQGLRAVAALVRDGWLMPGHPLIHAATDVCALSKVARTWHSIGRGESLAIAGALRSVELAIMNVK